MRGKFLWYNQTKGYGFIKGEDGQNYFVHISQLNIAKDDYIKPETEASFIPKETEKGLQAHNVVILDD